MKGTRKLRLFSRWLHSRFRASALILGYHRVAQLDHDPYGIGVSPANFEAHLQVLRQRAHPVRLSSMLEGLERHTLPGRSVVLTFDDGYCDLLTTVEPLLRHYEIPATVFVVSGNLGQPFWWDRLHRLVYSDEPLPDTLNQYAVNHTEREDRLWAIYQALLNLPETRRCILLEAVNTRGDGRALTETELQQLTHSDWIEIGSHTVSHPMLADLTPGKQRYEIEESKRHLESLTGHPIAGFSYPNGSFCQETELATRAAGYQYACISENGPVHAGSNPYQLPRFWVPDCDGTQFANWIERWL